MTISAINQSPVEIIAPPSKSISHRYLIAAALANGVSVVRHTLESADIEVTRAILCAAGAEMNPLLEDGKITGWQVKGMAGKPQGGTDTPLQCNVQESGTTCRLVTAVLAAGKGLFRIYGSGRMSERPIGDLCTILQSLGSGIAYEGKKGFPPFLLQANQLNPTVVDGYVIIGMDDSSQYFSGLLMAAPLALGALSIELGGKQAVSWPYVGLTLQCLDNFGIKFSVQNRPRLGVPWNELQKTTWRNLKDAKPGCLRVRIWPGAYKSGDYTVEGDWSGAAYFLAAGVLGSRPVCVHGLNPDSLQGDKAILDILISMGAKIDIASDSITVYPSDLRGISIDMSACPDLVPTVAVLAAYAKGSTRITNVAHLRIKESDRIAATAQELSKTGVIVDALSDGLLINGMGGTNHLRNKPDHPLLPDGAALCSHNDHRIAMSLALLELRQENLNVADRLDDASVVRKSFPEFWHLWSKVNVH